MMQQTQSILNLIAKGEEAVKLEELERAAAYAAQEKQWLGGWQKILSKARLDFIQFADFSEAVMVRDVVLALSIDDERFTDHQEPPSDILKTHFVLDIEDLAPIRVEFYVNEANKLKWLYVSPKVEQDEDAGLIWTYGRNTAYGYRSSQTIVTHELSRALYDAKEKYLQMKTWRLELAARKATAKKEPEYIEIITDAGTPYSTAQVITQAIIRGLSQQGAI